MSMLNEFSTEDERLLDEIWDFIADAERGALSIGLVGSRKDKDKDKDKKGTKNAGR